MLFKMNFNHRAGLTEEDDRLPAIFYKEKRISYHGTVSYADKELDATLEPFKYSAANFILLGFTANERK